MKAQPIQLRVRYAETDKMGYAYYGNYATYLEVARVEAFRSLGIEYAEVEMAGFIFPIVKMELDYIRPLVYDELFTVHLEFELLQQSRIIAKAEILKANGKLANTSIVTLACVSVGALKSCDFPEYVLDLFHKE